MNIFFLLGLLSSLVVAPFGCAFLYSLTKEWRFSKKTVLLFTVLMHLILGYACIAIYKIYGDSSIARLLLMGLIIIMIFIGYLLLAAYQHGRNIFISLSSVVFLLSLAAIGEILCSDFIFLKLLSRMVVFFLLQFLLIKYWRHPLLEMAQEFTGRWLQLSAIPLTLSVVLFILLSTGNLYYQRMFQIIAVIMVCITFFIYLALYHIFSSLKLQFSDQADYAILKEQMLSLELQTETMLHNNEQLNIFNHDIRHYIQILKTCLTRKNAAAAIEILEAMHNHIETIDSSVQTHTGNILVDAILSDYSDRAKAHQIEFEIQLTLSKSLEEDSIDFAIVVANGLENAFNACQKIPADACRKVILSGCQQARMYIFCIENTYTGEIHFLSKQHVPVSDQKGHGYGTRSILAFAKKHDAFVDFTTDKEWFILRLIFSDGM